MKQYLKSLCVGLAAAASLLAATESHALPAFARQMGVGCNTCHYQTFPLLNAFGRQFKASGFTMIREEKTVEDSNLSIPVVLNAAIFTVWDYEKTNGVNDAGETKKTANDGQYDLPAEFTLFVGGRASENIGFIAEAGFVARETSSGGILGAVKIPMLWDVGMARVGAIPFSTGGVGPAHSFETLNTGAVGVHTLMFGDHSNVYSAQQYLGTGTAASGVGFVAVNDMGFINLTKWSPNNATSGASPSANYLRIVATPPNLIQGWDIGFGFQNWSGSALAVNDPYDAVEDLPTPTNFDAKAWAVDAQFMGNVGNLPLGIFTSYGIAKASTCDADGAVVSSNANLYNSGCADIKAFGIGAQLAVVPQKVFLQLAYRNAKTPDPAGGAAGFNTLSDNAWSAGVVYKLAQNIKFSLSYTKASGSLYDSTDAGYPNASAENGGGSGDSRFSFAFEAGL